MKEPFTLDLAGRERVYMRVAVALPSGTELLSVMEPTKALADAVDALLGRMGDGGEGTANAELYAVAARILSNNEEGVEVARAAVEASVPLSQCVELVAAYSAFEREQIGLLLKNLSSRTTRRKRG